ncbi:winged helix-turn-helix domain-containing protein [Lysobacter fragariae]
MQSINGERMRPKYLFGEFELNPASRELLRNGKPIALRPKSLECLVYLIEHRDRAVGRDELISAVWGRVDASDTVVAQTLLRARKALDDTGNQQVMIRTLPRFGYRWVAPIREVAVPSDASMAEAGDAGGRGAMHSASASAHYVEADSEIESDIEGEALDVDVALEAELPETIGAGVEEATEVSSAIGKRRRLLRIGLPLLIALIVAVGLGFLVYSRYRGEGPTQAADDAVLVMPVAVVPMDSENAWARLGAMDYMAARLRASGVNVLPSEQAMRLSTAIEGDAPAVARKKLRSLSGARWIVLPQMQREGNGWRVVLRLFEGGREQRLQARGNTALAAVAEVADVWLRQLGGQGESGPPPSPVAERLQRLDAEILAGRLQEATRLLRTSLPAERRDPRFLYREAKLEFRAGHVDVAATLFQQALDQATDADTPTKIGALQGLAGAERARNNVDAAELRFTQALKLLQSLPSDRINSRLTGLVYQGLGIIRAQRGDVGGGMEYLGQSRVWIQRSGDLVLLGAIGHNIGLAEILRGNYAQALSEFDRSIETFERFRVNDYLVNSLSEKASLLLALARPADAWDAIRRAQPYLPKLEDNRLMVQVLVTTARIQMAQGRMNDAGDTLARIQSRGVRDTDPALLELLLRLHVAQGELGGARKLVRSAPPPAPGDDRLMLVAVQTALRIGDLPLAKSWLASDASVGEQDARHHAVDLELARSLIARAEGDGATALAHADRAAGVAGMSPEAEIQTGVVQARVLLDARQYDAASAIMGRLEKYAETDYRVAWSMLALYRALGDQRAAVAALERANALRGDRDVAVEPVL